jgi:hypothetical protein
VRFYLRAHEVGLKLQEDIRKHYNGSLSSNSIHRSPAPQPWLSVESIGIFPSKQLPLHLKDHRRRPTQPFPIFLSFKVTWRRPGKNATSPCVTEKVYFTLARGHNQMLESEERILAGGLGPRRGGMSLVEAREPSQEANTLLKVYAAAPTNQPTNPPERANSRLLQPSASHLASDKLLQQP